jgi:hypothetical protein
VVDVGGRCWWYSLVVLVGGTRCVTSSADHENTGSLDPVDLLMFEYTMTRSHASFFVFRYLRGSMSVLGLLPPMPAGEDNSVLLVDGGYCNNLPFDVMETLVSLTHICTLVCFGVLWCVLWCFMFTSFLLHVCFMFASMFTSCLLHVCFMFASCLLHVCFMFASCLLHVCFMFASCLLQCLLHVCFMFASCLLHVYFMFTS